MAKSLNTRSKDTLVEVEANSTADLFVVRLYGLWSDGVDQMYIVSEGAPVDIDEVPTVYPDLFDDQSALANA
jgi:hypothetical protein